MYWRSSPWIPWNSMRSDPQQDRYIFYSQIPVYLGGKPGTERVVIFTSTSHSRTMAQIQRYDESTKSWSVEYTKEADGVPCFMVLTGYWELELRNVVVLYSITGSEGYLSYTVVGRDKDKMIEYISRENIFQGSVRFEGGKLVEGYGVRAQVWKKRNRRLALEPVRIPTLPGAMAIEFSIQPQGKIKTAKTQYTIPVDTTVQLVRTDLNPISERVLYSYPVIYKYIPHRTAFVMKDKGKVEISIIPEGYDRDRAVNLTVEAV